MHVVEIRRDGEALAGPMEQMRTWLDAKGIKPSQFRMSLTARGTVFRLEFVLASEAAAFAQALGGVTVRELGDHPVAA